MPAGVLRVTEATFARQVLRSELPALVCFGARSCPGRRALAPALERIAAEHAGRLRVAALLSDGAALLSEQYGVALSPTLMVFAGGERQGQALGFLPEGLLRLLAEDVLSGALRGDTYWSPVEERYEETVLIPMLERWGLAYQRQAPCALPGSRHMRGRVDLLVTAGPGGPPLTLVECKRHIRSAQELGQAAAQAAGYAQSLGLPGFLVAAPPGVWAYRQGGARPACVRQISALELHQSPELLRALIAP